MEAYRVERRRARRRRMGSCLVGLSSVTVLAAASRLPAEAPARWMLAAVAVLAAVVAWKAWPEPDGQRWQRGAAGELATARLLQRLPGRYVVLHDRRIPGSRANLDHVVIGPEGVWVIDSKAYRSHLRAGWRSVWAGDRRLDVTPVLWEADVVADRLGITVHPLVVIHGDGLPRRGRRCRGVRVVPADGLLRRLRTRWWWPNGGRLSAADVDGLEASCRRIFPPASVN